MAFDTKYEVSTQVDSSEPADKFPEMWGSATLAMEVSSTSMKVAKVTVTAITQGLMFPSGVRNLDKILFNMAAIPELSSSSLLRSKGPIYSNERAIRCYSVTMVASTFMPGRRIALSGEMGSNTIFTGMRCTTFT